MSSTQSLSISGTRFRLFLAALLILTFLCAFPAASQQAPTPSSLDALPEAASFVIGEVEYHIQGITGRGALRRYLGIEVGSVFASRRALGDFLLAKLRLLQDSRVFDDSCRIEVESMGVRPAVVDGNAGPAESAAQAPGVGPGSAAGAAAQGRALPVRILVHTRDTWTALALPFPKYSQSEGLRFALRAKDFNFLGSLYPLTLAFDYYFLTKKIESGFSFQIYPRMLGAEWSFPASTSFRYTELDGFELYDTTTSLRADYALGGFLKGWSATPALSYAYTYSERKHRADAGASFSRSIGSLPAFKFSLASGYGLTWIDRPVHWWTNSIALSTTITLASLPFQAALNLEPRAKLFADLVPATWSPAETGIELASALGYSAVDWRENFRSGSSVKIAGTWRPRFAPASADQAFDLYADLDITAFAALRTLAGLSFRIKGRWDAGRELIGNDDHSTDLDWGGMLRGIPDGLYSDLAIIANLGLPLNLAQGRFFQAEKLSAELHLVPFVDAGIVRRFPGGPESSSRPIDLARDGALCAGLEAILFPTHAPSYVYRISAGYDLTRLLRGEAFGLAGFELWMGLGQHY